MEPARDVSGINVRAVVRYVRARQGDTGVARVLERAGEDPTEPRRYEDVRRWWPHDTMQRIFAAAAEVLDDERVAFGVGASILEHLRDTPMRVAFTLLGGPAQVFRVATKSAAKFTRAGQLTTVGYGRDRVLLQYRTNPGYTPSRYDCDYAQGLLSQVPCVYGLPPAEVRHSSCELEGDAWCTYEVRWKSRRRGLPGRRATDRSPVADAMADQLRNLQLTVATLVNTRQPDQVLASIAERAGSAVNAYAFLLVAQPGPDLPEQQHSYGLTRAEVADLVAKLREGATGDLSRNTISVPIVSADHTFGHLVALASDFLDTERELLHSYANLAAAALDTASALRVAAERQRTAEGLFRLARSLTESRTPAAVAEVTAQAGAEVMGTDIAVVLLFDEDSRLVMAGQAGFPERQQELLRTLAITPHDTGALAARLANPRQPVRYDRDSADPYMAELLAVLELRAIAVVGIAGADRVHGVLVTGYLSGSGRGTHPDEEFAERMTGIADQAATALRNCELLDETWQLAYRDALTGLANRRAFTDKLAEAVQDVNSALLFIDLDGFKSVNDSLGHTVGDELLRVTGNRLRGCTRQNDFVARLGGDEFVVLLPGVGAPEQLVEAAERVADAFARPVTVDGHLIPVRLSIGGTLFGPGYDSEDVLQRADRAMYEAKRSRTGAVHLAGDQPLNPAA